MKARVKATGKMLPETTIVSFYDDGSMDDFFLNELELIPDDNSPDYWTRLEHTYAGMAMQGILANIDLLMSLAKKKADDYPAKHTVTEFAKDCAHALVEKMKEVK